MPEVDLHLRGHASECKVKGNDQDQETSLSLVQSDSESETEWYTTQQYMHGLADGRHTPTVRKMTERLLVSTALDLAPQILNLNLLKMPWWL